MYSVEDLLISHGYKLPKQSTSASSARPAPSASPPSYSRHQQLLERPRTVNGYCSYTLNSSHPRERSQSRQERPISDIGFCDGNRSLQLQAKDVSYWRRKAQDFAVLLNYTDYKEGAGGGRQGSYVRPERAEEVRGLGPVEECPRSERPRCRENQQLLPWRTTERKCQSLGVEEWHPAEQRLLSRTPEGMVLPRTKAKTQSLPRMQNNCRQYVPLFHQSTYRAPRWPDSSRPASANQLSITPKPRFTRPSRPPSYEMHQQIRGSCELLSGRDSVRERTPLPKLRTAESQLDYFAQDCGPPGYIPPPSYKRAPIMEGVCRDYGEVAIDYRYRGDVYQQLHRAPDGSHWCPPQAGGCNATTHCRQLYPVYVTQDRPGARIQYIPFDHTSTLGGNSLTDSDKIRHIRKELPSLTVSEPASGNSAFMPPSLGPSLVGNLVNDSNPAFGDFEGDNSRWHRHLHKDTVDNIPAMDQNYNNRYHKIQHGRPTSPFSAFHVPASSSGLRCRSEQGFLETITQVKQIRPDLGSDNNRNPKRRFSETIFCLVSVPVHTPANSKTKNAPADQNNNETTSQSIPDTFAVGLKESRPVRSRSVNQVPIWSHYSTFDTSGTSSLRNYKRAPLRKEIIDAWALQANDNKEMYSRSWPGHQYRNQETQTGSPLVKSPEPEVPEEKPTQAVSGTSADPTSTNSFLLKDQKNLQLSSNSAFSPLSPSQTSSEKASHSELMSPLQNSNSHLLPLCNPSQNSSAPSTDSTEQIGFGQFLLKPVDRRPCDIIGALESINKEMEDTISKRAGMLVNRKGKKKHNIHQSGAQSMEDMHLEKPNFINIRSKSFTSDAEMDAERSCSFFKPRNERIQPTQEHTDFAQDSEQTQQDIPVPQESMLRDVGLKVYTETGPSEPTPRSCSVPPFQSLDELAWVARTTKDPQEHKTHRESKAKSSHKHHTSGVSLRICRSRSESSRSSHKRECSPHVNKLNRVGSCPNNNEASVADEHLENLLIQEKTNSLPAEDFSHLYEVKCADGIPENESIEQRAARILGIAVPVGTLGVEKAEEIQESISNVDRVEGNIIKDLSDCVQNHQTIENNNRGEMTQHVLDNGLPVGALCVEKGETIQHDSESRVEDKGKIVIDTSNCVGSIPEDYCLEPTANICNEETIQKALGNALPDGVLSIAKAKVFEVVECKVDEEEPNVEKGSPVFPECRALSIEKMESNEIVIKSKVEPKEGEIEKGSRGCSPFESEAQNQNIYSAETSQQVLDNAANDGPSYVERTEVIEDVTEQEEGKISKREQTENICGEETTQQVLDFRREEEEILSPEVCVDCSKETAGREEEAAEESQSKACLEEGTMFREEDKSNGKVAIYKEHCGSMDFKERQVLEAKEEILIALVDDEGIKEVAELQPKDPGKVDLKGMRSFEKEGRETNIAVRGENSQVGIAKPPRPKQRTKLQKPALLPKPRCVPKREIRLPAHNTTSTEVQNQSDIPDNYDPSRVERV